MDVLISCALPDDAAAAAALRGLALPRLQALLALLQIQRLPDLPPDSLVPMDEALQAQALGLDAQAPPWAALRAHALGLDGAATEAWAWLDLLHWEVGTAQVTLRALDAPALDAEAAQALLAAMQPYFAEDGLRLHLDAPARWLVQGERLRGLRGASLARVLDRDVAPWLPAAPWLRRLQTEMQMLLYTQALNDARTHRGALPVSGFWLSGAGALAQPPAPATLQRLDALQEPARAGDWAAWARQWAALDAELAPLLQAARAGQPVTLTLCGELRALRLGPARAGLLQRLRRRHPSEILLPR